MVDPDNSILFEFDSQSRRLKAGDSKRQVARFSGPFALGIVSSACINGNGQVLQTVKKNAVAGDVIQIACDLAEGVIRSDENSACAVRLLKQIGQFLRIFADLQREVMTTIADTVMCRVIRFEQRSWDG